MLRRSKRPSLLALALLALVLALAPWLQLASATPADNAQPSSQAAPTTQMVGKGKVDLYQPSAPSSGFWTSRTPAKGGAYRYTLLLIGTGVVLLTAGLLIFGLRRVDRARQP